MIRAAMWKLFGGMSILISAVAVAGVQEGMDALGRGDYGAALKEFRVAAEAGDDAAEYNLGLLHEKGLGVEQDHAAALNWYRRGAKKDYAPSWYSLGLMHLNGQGVKADPEEGKDLLRKAAGKGYAPAQFTLGVIHERGEDPAAARKWYEEAADLRFSPAMMRIGLMDLAALQHDASNRDLLRSAYAWLTLALLHGMDAQGFATINSARERLVLTMDAREIMAATQLARDWLLESPSARDIVASNPLARGWLNEDEVAALASSPEVAFPDYLSLDGADFVFGFEGAAAQGTYVVTLSPGRKLPDQAFVEIGFENPADTRAPLRVTREIGRVKDLRIESPRAGGFVCRPYRLAMAVYEDESRERMLGVLRIVVLSRVDTSKVGSAEELVQKMKAQGHACD
ncbi:MAG: tetratricopeptide repeat protein [Gammaproteobacteria bacterium]|jgi:hypothetical protein|nr:tetratricopeptide repeat protein [Gammaproteobacteria bacterium]